MGAGLPCYAVLAPRCVIYHRSLLTLAPWGLDDVVRAAEAPRLGIRLSHGVPKWGSLQSGTSLQELMELGGWRSYEMVLRYAHLAPEKLSSVASRIERQPEGCESDGRAARQKRSGGRYVWSIEHCRSVASS
jgi:hypothetical protein